MPRPKPPALLRARHIRMSDAQHNTFQLMGGAAWLRDTMDKPTTTRIARLESTPPPTPPLRPPTWPLSVARAPATHWNI